MPSCVAAALIPRTAVGAVSGKLAPELQLEAFLIPRHPGGTPGVCIADMRNGTPE